MNLIDDQWLPFRARDGSVRYGPPHEVIAPDLVDVALPRADFHGAAWQFLIGLLQTAWAPRDDDDWIEAWQQPPDPNELSRAFSRCRHAFQVVGDGPLFMQDFDPLPDARTAPVSSLLIEAPGAQALKFNADHFIKRGIADVMSPSSAALALFTMQINAPAGGKGYRTGLRGGGPLTTLVLPQDEGATLWHKLWLNVLSRTVLEYDDPPLDSPALFPWLGSTRTSERPGSETYFTDVHPLHVYWAMPRRFRLEIEDQPCICDVGGVPAERSVRNVRTVNYGYNYDGVWAHPLTPYREDPKKPDQPPLSAKGQQGGLGYRHWEGLVLEDRTERGNLPALVVGDYTNKARLLADVGQVARKARLWVFGYDMDNMKARGWYSTQMPLLSVPVERQDVLLGWTRELTNAAREVSWRLRSGVKAAWFSRPGDAKGDFSFVDQAFWEATEAEFYACMRELVTALEADPGPMPAEVAHRWYRCIRSAAETEFDRLALSADAEVLDMKRVTAARSRLRKWLRSGKEMKGLRARAGMNDGEGGRVRGAEANEETT